MKPKILDLFCGAGGASVGYNQAGFDVDGVDHIYFKRYPFKFQHTLSTSGTTFLTT
jgi:DNA (cytosine-5)-methyltransferase 1